jgi:hypothetical protein
MYIIDGVTSNDDVSTVTAFKFKNLTHLSGKKTIVAVIMMNIILTSLF